MEADPSKVAKRAINSFWFMVSSHQRYFGDVGSVGFLGQVSPSAVTVVP
jgi:hypothetical protein